MYRCGRGFFTLFKEALLMYRWFFTESVDFLTLFTKISKFVILQGWQS